MARPKKKESKAVALNVDLVKSIDRRVLPVSGIFGGLNNQGLLVAHLYVEYPDMPTSGKVEIDLSNKHVVENSLHFRPDHITREIVATIAIPGGLIPAFREWFNSQAEFISKSKTVNLK